MKTRTEQGQTSALRRMALIAIIATCVLAPGSSWAQSQMYIYPAKGQSQQQQDKDRYECHTWAVQQSGFDPSTASAANPNQYDPQPSSSRGQVLRGAGRGAAMGAVGGAIAGDAGTGAAAGAAMGGMAGGIRRRQERKQQAAAQQQQQAQGQQSQVAAYQRAMAACLQGRGYTVN